jgi:hypothetical protein
MLEIITRHSRHQPSFRVGVAPSSPAPSAHPCGLRGLTAPHRRKDCINAVNGSPYLSLAALSSTRGVEVFTLKPIDLMTAIYAAANHTTIADANFLLDTERSHISF